MSLTESVISNKGSESVTEADVRTEDEQPQISGHEDIVLRGGIGFRDRWRQALGILVCLEVGIFLFAVPWSALVREFAVGLLSGYATRLGKPLSPRRHQRDWIAEYMVCVPRSLGIPRP